MSKFLLRETSRLPIAPYILREDLTDTHPRETTALSSIQPRSILYNSEVRGSLRAPMKNPRRALPGAPGSATQPSLELLYRHHFSWLLSSVRRRFGANEAEDLVQEVYIRASAYQGREVSNPRALLMQIATRAAIDRVRREQARPPTQGASADHLSAEASQDDALTLKQTILQLPPRLREVFLLSRFGGLSYEEIAEHLGLSVKTVEWRMTKALRLCAAKVRTWRRSDGRALTGAS